ncbi:MAG: ABC transporter permease subunit [Coxiellaceae bacterium]|nr:MAG: ABC transporter permease subunit [Coxiellaceae bacterium]
MLVFAYLPQLFQGLWLTLALALCALACGLLLGMIGALGEATSRRGWRYSVITIQTVIRGVPELVVVMFVYFAGTALLNALNITSNGISPFIAGVIALSLLFGAYASQTLRGAFAAIPRGQQEAAKALALNRWQTFYRILLPQAWRHALPGLGNLWLVLLKDSALVSLIGLAELMTKAKVAAITTGQPFVFYCIAAVIYLLLTLSFRIIAVVFQQTR